MSSTRSLKASRDQSLHGDLAGRQVPDVVGDAARLTGRWWEWVQGRKYHLRSSNTPLKNLTKPPAVQAYAGVGTHPRRFVNRRLPESRPTKSSTPPPDGERKPASVATAQPNPAQPSVLCGLTSAAEATTLLAWLYEGGPPRRPASKLGSGWQKSSPVSRWRPISAWDSPWSRRCALA